LTYVTEEQRSRTGWIVCQMLVEILADGTSQSDCGLSVFVDCRDG
jgi:hypothetical protein